MTAPLSPEDQSETSKELAASEQQGFIYDDPTAEPSEVDSDYVPEREFVLMPLFRRIGEMLGLGRYQEQHYIYTAEPQPRTTHVERAAEPEPVSAAPQQSFQSFPTSVVQQEVGALEEQHETAVETRSDPSPVVTYEEHPPEPQPLEVQQAAVAEPEPVAAYEPEEEQQLVARAAEPDPVPTAELPVPEPPVHAEIAAPAVVRKAEPQPASTRPALTQEDVKELIAPIRDAAREAAASISLAISQTAEWLHAKQEEILGRAEASLGAPSRKPRRKTLPQGVAPRSAPGAAPALQREMAWRTERRASQANSAAAPVVPSSGAQRRPQLVRKPARIAFWKRIDWAREFTPARAGVLGAVAMAALMFVGISLARRPASSVLPQQQTRTLEPGGVTLTTHPTTTVAQPSRPNATKPRAVLPSVPSQHAAAPASRRARRTADPDDGPEVVTHHYNQSKPSPIHQSTIAGVRHYSDMQ